MIEVKRCPDKTKKRLKYSLYIPTVGFLVTLRVETGRTTVLSPSHLCLVKIFRFSTLKSVTW